MSVAIIFRKERKMSNRKRIIKEFDSHRHEDLFDCNHLPIYFELDECLLILPLQYVVNVEDSKESLNFIIFMFVADGN